AHLPGWNGLMARLSLTSPRRTACQTTSSQMCTSHAPEQFGLPLVVGCASSQTASSNGCRSKPTTQDATRNPLAFTRTVVENCGCSAIPISSTSATTSTSTTSAPVMPPRHASGVCVKAEMASCGSARAAKAFIVLLTKNSLLLLCTTV